MLKSILKVWLLFTSIFAFSQEISINQHNSFELFVDNLKNSKDFKYQEVLDRYDAYIDAHPNDIVVQVYKCKFIGTAYYDEYEDYNLKYDETEDCIDKLYSFYPKNSDVLLYKIENFYGEGREALIEEAIELYESDTSKWRNEQISSLYEIAAYHYTETNDYRANKYALKAERFSDSLDLSVMLTNINLRLGNKEKAKEHLVSSLYQDNNAWVLNQKAELLIKFDEVDEALKMFDRAKKKDSTYTNNESLYKIFLKNGNPIQARAYLVEDTLATWNKEASIQKLLTHDIAYSDAEMALSVYRRMQEESYYDDFFGIKRLKLFFKSPLSSWTFIEFSHVVLLLVLMLFLFLIPYLWVLPIYGASKYFKFKKIKETIRLPVDWSLKHFWLISFVYLFCQVVLVLVFYYQDYMNYLFDIAYTYADEEIIESDLDLANSMIVFSGFLLISTLLFLNKKRWHFTISSTLSIRQILGFSILFIVFNGILLKILGGFIDLSDTANFIKSLNAKEEIRAILNEYGFLVAVLIAALIVPFYEEIIFRGIILTSTEKQIGFKWANVVQALLFATVHFNLKLFAFYFVFGIITGYAVKKTMGLFTGFVFHAVNNFVVVFVLYKLVRTIPTFNY